MAYVYAGHRDNDLAIGMRILVWVRLVGCAYIVKHPLIVVVPVRLADSSAAEALFACMTGTQVAHNLGWRAGFSSQRVLALQALHRHANIRVAGPLLGSTARAAQERSEKPNEGRSIGA